MRMDAVPSYSSTSPTVGNAPLKSDVDALIQSYTNKTTRQMDTDGLVRALSDMPQSQQKNALIQGLQAKLADNAFSPFDAAHIDKAIQSFKQPNPQADYDRALANLSRMNPNEPGYREAQMQLRSAEDQLRVQREMAKISDQVQQELALVNQPPVEQQSKWDQVKDVAQRTYDRAEAAFDKLGLSVKARLEWGDSALEYKVSKDSSNEYKHELSAKHHGISVTSAGDVGVSKHGVGAHANVKENKQKTELGGVTVQGEDGAATGMSVKLKAKPFSMNLSTTENGNMKAGASVEYGPASIAVESAEFDPVKVTPGANLIVERNKRLEQATH